ncbi:hypothetical protein ALI144C_27525 [Actinosynnema sp. ALI-1.44]|uniref:hypothetical protein n=1 Tax=Actinosynnema sp. ALI-1.44 TaxID=1933779 RepID=UPI00097C9C9A|nr:hypothetical protein [Actinosynnema sp. ALI-1.44]ONI78574.1 hypothetical protein ALI144C_27525 [Actinosynnema sp. ALI-1.44]
MDFTTAHLRDINAWHRFTCVGPSSDGPPGTAGTEVGVLSVHTPDLDDVFLALTGRPTTPKETSVERRGDHAAAS